MQHETEATLQVIHRLFADQLHIEVPSPDTDLLTGGLLDSFSLINLIAMLETELEVTIQLDDLDTDLANLRTLRTMASYVETLRGTRDAGFG